MAWKATGQPTVRKQRDKWAVRIDGIDTAPGNDRPRQLGTYASQRSAQAAARSMRAERLAAGTEWEDDDLIITTRTGRLVLPRSYDRALATIVDHAGLPRLTSHGLRHTAATHMVQSAHDLGELRAFADLLGHSPEMLMNTYAHALPDSQAAVVERLRRQ